MRGIRSGFTEYKLSNLKNTTYLLFIIIILYTENNIMKRQILITMVIMLLLPISIFSQNYPLQVIITPKQKFPSNLAIFKERPSDYISISVVNTAEAKDIYFELKLQQLTPSRD